MRVPAVGWPGGFARVHDALPQPSSRRRHAGFQPDAFLRQFAPLQRAWLGQALFLCEASFFLTTGFSLKSGFLCGLALLSKLFLSKTLGFLLGALLFGTSLRLNGVLTGLLDTFGLGTLGCDASFLRAAGLFSLTRLLGGLLGLDTFSLGGGKRLLTLCLTLRRLLLHAGLLSGSLAFGGFLSLLRLALLVDLVGLGFRRFRAA